jgi:hypothetical protein
MAQMFLARVELRDAVDADAYERLHVEMKRQGFARTINVGGALKRLPTGTYVGMAGAAGPTVAQARDRAASAALRSGHTASIVVAGTDESLEESALDHE